MGPRQVLHQTWQEVHHGQQRSGQVLPGKQGTCLLLLLLLLL
jgi:hypothetical protein